jgi:hypothetical protein
MQYKDQRQECKKEAPMQAGNKKTGASSNTSAGWSRTIQA